METHIRSNKWMMGKQKKSSREVLKRMITWPQKYREEERKHPGPCWLSSSQLWPSSASYPWDGSSLCGWVDAALSFYRENHCLGTVALSGFFPRMLQSFLIAGYTYTFTVPCHNMSLLQRENTVKAQPQCYKPISEINTSSVPIHDAVNLLQRRKH